MQSVDDGHLKDVIFKKLWLCGNPFKVISVTRAEGEVLRMVFKTNT